MPQKELTAVELQALRVLYERHLAACESVGCEPEPIWRFISEISHTEHTLLAADDYTKQNLSDGLEQRRYRQYAPPRGER